MFVRFRETAYRLQLSLIETRRIGGRVRHEHIASLGSIEIPPSVAARIEFWRRLHDRLAKLSNRVDAETHAKVLGAVHARVPMPSSDEQRQLQLDNAKEDARIWSSLQDLHQSRAGGHKGLISRAQDAVTSDEAAAAQAAAKAKVAQDRIERIERGENVEGGLGKPIDVEAIMTAAGWTKADFRNVKVTAAIGALGEDVFKQFLAEAHKNRERTERAFGRAFARRFLPGK
jgi:hypothetical protein